MNSRPDRGLIAFQQRRQHPGKSVGFVAGNPIKVDHWQKKALIGRKHLAVQHGHVAGNGLE